MKLEDIILIDKENYMNTFGERTPVCFEYGKGVYLYSSDGKKYTDLFAGIAVNILGHGHPALTEAICSQAKKLIHCSNLYYKEPQALLAQKLNGLIGGGYKMFFANSGAEANEGAIKLARAYFNKKGMPYKNEIITMNHSFHGRTVTTITATAQPKYQKYFTPLTPGFKYSEPNDIEMLENTVNEHTCAVMLEIIQGESGVYPMTENFLDKVRELCREKDILLIIDEVQTGIGRTGSMFAYQNTKVKPDIFTLAKALGGGVPIGAVCASDEVAPAFSPGDHGTTFGGNPLACAAALAVLETVEKESIIDNVNETGKYFFETLEKIKKETGSIKEIRGRGLMIGIEFNEPCAVNVKNRLFEKGYLVGSVGNNILRILPPLIFNKENVEDFAKVLSEIINGGSV